MLSRVCASGERGKVLCVTFPGVWALPPISCYEPAHLGCEETGQIAGGGVRSERIQAHDSAGLCVCG